VGDGNTLSTVVRSLQANEAGQLSGHGTHWRSHQSLDVSDETHL
jgi:hypothetical protein